MAYRWYCLKSVGSYWRNGIDLAVCR
uniref:Uncharacterized protein n=1 Tax=Anguilla anguilla TaxID=7936 RepID=A0A0E9QMU1_ANGAN